MIAPFIFTIFRFSFARSLLRCFAFGSGTTLFLFLIVFGVFRRKHLTDQISPEKDRCGGLESAPCKVFPVSSERKTSEHQRQNPEYPAPPFHTIAIYSLGLRFPVGLLNNSLMRSALQLLLVLCSSASLLAGQTGLTLARDGHWLVISGDQIPAGEIRINYLEAYCRSNSTDADWVKQEADTDRRCFVQTRKRENVLLQAKVCQSGNGGPAVSVLAGAMQNALGQ